MILNDVVKAEIMKKIDASPSPGASGAAGMPPPAVAAAKAGAAAAKAGAAAAGAAVPKG
jgi:hypothetical protein